MPQGWHGTEGIPTVGKGVGNPSRAQNWGDVLEVEVESPLAHAKDASGSSYRPGSQVRILVRAQRWFESHCLRSPGFEPEGWLDDEIRVDRSPGQCTRLATRCPAPIDAPLTTGIAAGNKFEPTLEWT